jgi:small subunit ribosomal protein S21
MAGSGRTRLAPVFHFDGSTIHDGRHMIEIQIGEGDRIEWALKQFRRKMLRSGLFKDMKKKQFYEKPSEAKKRKQADARRRNARARRRR